jgi:hypothetical protein
VHQRRSEGSAATISGRQSASLASAERCTAIPASHSVSRNGAGRIANQTRQSQPVHEVFSGDACDTQLHMPRKPTSPSDDVPRNGGDLGIAQFVMGCLELHDGRVDCGEQDRNLQRGTHSPPMAPVTVHGTGTGLLCRLRLEPRIGKTRCLATGPPGVRQRTYPYCSREDVVMKMEDIRRTRAIVCPGSISTPTLVQECKSPPVDEHSDDAHDTEHSFSPSPKPVWPRVWPGL